MHEFLPGKVHPVLQQKILCSLKRDNLKRGYHLTVNWVWDDQALALRAVQPTSIGLGCAPGDTCRCVRRSRWFWTLWLWGLTRARPNAGANPLPEHHRSTRGRALGAAQALWHGCILCLKQCVFFKSASDRSDWNTSFVSSNTLLFPTPASSHGLGRWQCLHLLSFPLAAEKFKWIMEDAF